MNREANVIITYWVCKFAHEEEAVWIVRREMQLRLLFRWFFLSSILFCIAVAQHNGGRDR